MLDINTILAYYPKFLSESKEKEWLLKEIVKWSHID